MAIDGRCRPLGGPASAMLLSATVISCKAHTPSTTPRGGRGAGGLHTPVGPLRLYYLGRGRLTAPTLRRRGSLSAHARGGRSRKASRPARHAVRVGPPCGHGLHHRPRHGGRPGRVATHCVCRKAFGELASSPTLAEGAARGCGAQHRGEAALLLGGRGCAEREPVVIRGCLGGEAPERPMACRGRRSRDGMTRGASHGGSPETANAEAGWGGPRPPLLEKVLAGRLCGPLVGAVPEFFSRSNRLLSVGEPALVEPSRPWPDHLPAGAPGATRDGIVAYLAGSGGPAAGPRATPGCHGPHLCWRHGTASTATYRLAAATRLSGCGAAARRGRLARPAPDEPARGLVGRARPNRPPRDTSRFWDLLDVDGTYTKELKLYGGSATKWQATSDQNARFCSVGGWC